jgi:hypothetical protein
MENKLFSKNGCLDFNTAQKLVIFLVIIKYILSQVQTTKMIGNEETKKTAHSLTTSCNNGFLLILFTLNVC